LAHPRDLNFSLVVILNWIKIISILTLQLLLEYFKIKLTEEKLSVSFSHARLESKMKSQGSRTFLGGNILSMASN
jgi:hypothetical protein